MGPKSKDKRKEAKGQRWKPLDVETKQPRDGKGPTVDADSAPNLSVNKTSSVSTPTPIEPTCDPQFRKRGISSNWGRYDEPIEVETEYNRQRGEDFDLLLSSSAGPSAHFRFKEQQDWQDEPADISEFLSTDMMDAIVQALHTIPLHKCLDLPEDIIPAKVIEEFNAEAAAEKERYEAFLRTGKQQLKKVSDVGESLKKSLQAAIATAAVATTKPKDEDDVDEELESLLFLKRNSKPVEADSLVKETVDKNEFLLSVTLDHGSKKVPVSGDTAPVVKAKGNASEEAAKLPSLPVSEDSAPVVKAKGDASEDAVELPSQPQKPAPKPQKPTVNLEDWLDSILQD
uniref:Cell death regulator Aven n=1 Tax=Amblyomma maculatum TaxID=34609 RepID=G3MKW0_AMBMU